MLSDDRVIELLRLGNPVRDDGDLPGPRSTAAELLRQRREERAVTRTEHRTRPDHAGDTRPDPDPPRRWRGPAVAVAVMTLVLAAAGVLFALTQLGGPDDAATDPDLAPSSTTTAAPADLDEATSRRAGRPYDPATHDLCAWFDPGEIAEIVTGAYEAAGAAALPSAFGWPRASTYPPVACSWSTLNVDLDSAEWDGSGSYVLSLSVDGDLAGLTERLGTLEDGAVWISLEDDGGQLTNRIDLDYEPNDTLSDHIALVGAIVRDVGAWTPPGPPARWHTSDTRLSVDGHDDVYLSTSVISDPAVGYQTGSVAHRTLDVSLTIADELLRRMNWIPEGPPDAP